MVFIESSDARALTMTACADKSGLQKGVELFWSGIGGRLNFYGALLERYGLQADVEAAGAFRVLVSSSTYRAFRGESNPIVATSMSLCINNVDQSRSRYAS